ncbi:MAG: hypothetical protein IKZ87_06250 [Actinomycetaceae bacterium]|nr:hypothetical protein [Actinomycetaceae bacterium]
MIVATDGFLEMTGSEYVALGRSLYGDHLGSWVFECPRCGLRTSGEVFSRCEKDREKWYVRCLSNYVSDVGQCGWDSYEDEMIPDGAWIIDGHGVAPLVIPQGKEDVLERLVTQK